MRCSWLKKSAFLCWFFVASVVHAHNLAPSLMSIAWQTDGALFIQLDVSDALVQQLNGPEPFAQYVATSLKFADGDRHTVPVTWSVLSADDKAPSQAPKLAEHRFMFLARQETMPTSLRMTWPEAMGDVVLKVGGETKETSTLWIRGGEWSDAFTPEHIADSSFLDFVLIGLEHILPKGVDHILFVIGICLFSSQLKALLLQVSAFTLAHTLTLFLVTLNVVSLDTDIVEPLIAVSIAYVALEGIFRRQVTRSRLAVVFGFGLLHGMGFAGALSEVGIKAESLVRDLIAFNMGVEIGQLAVVLCMYFLLGRWFPNASHWEKAIKIPLSVAIAVTGLVWMVQRV